MTLEIQNPQLEALILERVRRGAFQNVEEALMQALVSSQLPGEGELDTDFQPSRTGADLIAAIQASPFREMVIEPARYHLPGSA